MQAATQPKTLRGLKSIAKRIKKDDGIPHYAALEKASQQAGFSNYRHARAQLGES